MWKIGRYQGELFCQSLKAAFYTAFDALLFAMTNLYPHKNFILKAAFYKYSCALTFRKLYYYYYWMSILLSILTHLIRLLLSSPLNTSKKLCFFLCFQRILENTGGMIWVKWWQNDVRVLLRAFVKIMFSARFSRLEVYCRIA